MGQKTNPVIFRKHLNYSDTFEWNSTKKKVFFHNMQDLEIKNFLNFLLKGQGINVRGCKIKKSSQTLDVKIDFFFNLLLKKDVALLWAKSILRNTKKKYSMLKKFKEMKSFFQNMKKKKRKKAHSSLFFAKHTRVKKHRFRHYHLFLSKNSNKHYKKNLAHLKKIKYKKKPLFFLINVKKKHLCDDQYSKKLRDTFNIKKEKAIFSTWKNSKQPNLILYRFLYLKKLYQSKKFFYNFYIYQLQRLYPITCIGNVKKKLKLKSKKDGKPYALYKKIINFLHLFTGYEKVKLKLFCSQLNHLASYSYYAPMSNIDNKNKYERKIGDENDNRINLRKFSIFKNKEVKSYANQYIENLYFLLNTFGAGNACLFGKQISYLLEKTRVQTNVIRFLEESINLLYEKFSDTLPLQGVKILIKGRFNKRRRTKIMRVQRGQCPMQTFSVRVDYEQTQAINLYGCFGIKVWLVRKQTIVL